MKSRLLCFILIMLGILGQAQQLYLINGIATTATVNDKAPFIKPLAVTIDAGTITGSPFCAGTTVNVPFTITGTFNSGNIFTAQLSDASGSFASPVNIGTLNSTTAGTIAATIPVSATAGAGYRIRVVSSNPSFLAGTDNGADITVLAAPSPTIFLLVGPSNNVCPGTQVSFLTIISDGGTAPAYQWYKNGSPVGTNSPNYSSNTLVNGDVITCGLTSNAPCAGPEVLSGGVTMTVNPVVAPTVSISANPGSSICTGASVTFTATPTNGGTAPIYQWYKNTLPVGTNSATYTDNSLVAGDVISCGLTSNVNCISPTTATSNTITITIGGATSQVSGNNITIADGDATPSTADFTDFGSVSVNSSITKIFVLKNTGTTNLAVNSITVSGANASLFTVGALTPASPIAAGGSATFAVTFLPTTTGTKTATININNNSCNAATYDFAIQGNATAATVNTLAAQTFESGVCDTWSFTGFAQNTETARTGSGSGRIGRCLENAIGTFNPINTAGYAGLQFSLYHSVRSLSGPGMDTREGVVIQVRENGGAWVTVGRAGGNGDAGWGWTATGGTANTCTKTYTMPNPLVYTPTAGTTSFAFRVITINNGNKSSSNSSCPAGCSSSAATCCANFESQMDAADPSSFAKVYDRNDEGFFVDDIKLTTTSPLPIVLTSAAGTDAQTACINSPVTNIAYSVTGGGNATVTGLPTGVTGTYNNGTFTISGTPTTTVGSPFTYTVTSVCTGATATGVMTVKPTATLTLTSAANTNAQTICANTALTNIVYAIGGGGTGAGVTGLPAGVTGTYNAGVFTISGTPTVTGTFNYTVTTTGPCTPQATATGTMIIKPDATIALSSAANTNAQTLCVNTALTNIVYAIGGGGMGAGVTGLPAGLAGAYNAGVFTISGTPTATGTFHYTVTTTGTCIQVTATGTITVNPDATITLTSAANTNTQTLCINTVLTNITYIIAGGGTGAGVTGLPAGLTGVYNTGMFTISGTPTATGTFNYTVTTTGTCGQTTATGTITVNPDATITLTSAANTNAQTLCINTVLTNITYTIAGGGTGAGITGLPAGLTGVYNAGIFTISGTPTATGTFNYTITTTGNCVQTTATGSITVTPDATITLTSAANTNTQTVCINTAITNITYAIAGGGTGAGITGLPAGLIGVYNAGVFTISGTPTTTGTFNYTVTTTGTCGQTTATGTITFTPDATITLTSAVNTDAQTVCINTAITNITYAVAGGGTGAGVTGLPAGLTGVYNAGVFTISGTPTATGTFNYTVTTTGTCGQTTATGTIIVTPDATITLTSAANTNAQTVCINTAVTNITYAIAGGGTNANVAGLPAGLTGVYNAGVFTISGIPTITGTFNYTVTTTGTCGQTTATGTITVTPNAAIALSSAIGTDVQAVCINIAITNITYAITGGGTGAGVTGLPAGITGTYNAGTFTISGTPTVTGTFNYTVTTTGTCGQATATGTITVNPDATITLTSATNTNAQTVCVNNAITNITYAIAGGGTGAGVTGLPAGVTGAYNAGVFTISGTPTATGTFNYTVTTTGTCAQTTATGTITVNPDATITLTSAANTSAQTLCINTAITNIVYAIGGSGAGATVTGLPSGVTGTYSTGLFTISGTPTATGTFSYTVSTTGNCAQATAMGTITVNPDATIILTSAANTNAQTVCINTAITNITYAISGGGTGASVAGLPAGLAGTYNAGVFTIAGTPIASGTFNYTVATTGSCAQKTVTGTITVNPDATIVLTSPTATLVQTVCINTAIANIVYTVSGGGTGANITGLPAGVTAVYNAGVFTISGTPTAPGTFNYTINTTGTCTQVTAAGIITVMPNVLPTISIVASPTGILCAGTPITFTATITNGGTAPIYQWKKNGGNVGTNAATYTDNTLVTGDAITCTLTSNAPCANPLTVTSNAITVTMGGPVNQVTGNSVVIANGDISPTTTDNTDFGNVNANSTVTHTFTVTNTGLTNLAINSITISGADASLFTVGILTPASPIAPGGSATFTVSFSPINAGVKTATVNINNNSCSTALFSFAIQGNGITVPASALDFDGVNDYVSIPHSALLKPASQITIEAWVNPRDVHTNTYYEIYRKEDGNGRHLFSFQEHGTILSFGLGIGTAYAELDVPINKADYENQWVHVAATYDGKTKRVYRNGVLIGSVNTTGAIITTGTSPVLIGQNQAQPEYFNGKIDEVRLWERALCQTEIQQTMNCELTMPQNGLIAYYKFNQGFASVPNPGVTTLPDASGNNLNGTLMNFALTSSTSNWVTPGGVVTGVSCTPAQFALLTPAVVISSNPVSPICQGTMVTFTATPTNGGTAPTYVWKRNGTVIPGATSATYATNTLANTDDISCVLTSSEACVTTATANSNVLQMTVNAPITPTFAPIATVCQNAMAPVLPTTSTNGISGTWSPAISTATVGTATYTFTPSTGQCGTAATVQVTVAAPTVPTFAPVAAVCQNATAPVLPATSTNGINGTWSPAVNTATAGTATYTFTPTAGQCATATTISITVNPLPTLTVSPLTSSVCLGNSITLQATSNGTVQWQGFASGINSISITPTTSGPYQATATSALGCVNTATATVTAQPVFHLNITATPNPVTNGHNVTFATSSTMPYQITAWQPAGLFTNQTANSQTIVAHNSGEYYAVGRTAAGCIDTARINVQVITINNDLFIPNFFTPNNDGKNDVLKIYGTSIQSIEMRVFNQWGEMLFETKDINRGWDGTQNGKQQPVGVYIYVAKITLLNGSVVDKKGSVNLIR